jgi:hydrogenase maturation factor HypF (carbamoyltransferase family)
MLALGSATEDFILPVCNDAGGLITCDPGVIIRELFLLSGRRGLSYLARMFHNSIIEAMAVIAEKVCSAAGTDNVLLTGGVYQNKLILEGMEKRLARAGLNVFFNRKIPASDAGISVGQAVYGVYNA